MVLAFYSSYGINLFLDPVCLAHCNICIMHTVIILFLNYAMQYCVCTVIGGPSLPARAALEEANSLTYSLTDYYAHESNKLNSDHISHFRPHVF